MDHSQTRHDLAQEVLAMGKSAPIDLETVLDTEFDRGARFAEEAAAILAYEGETASEYQFRVTQWLLGLIGRYLSDEQCREYERRCDRDAAVEAEIERRRDEREAA